MKSTVPNPTEKYTLFSSSSTLWAVKFVAVVYMGYIFKKTG